MTKFTFCAELSLPRFGGGRKRGIYSTEGVQYGKGTKDYTREFKLEAVRLVKTSGKPMSQIARDLGISESELYQWCKHLAEQDEQAFPGSGHQSAQEEEIRRLKRELEIARQERDILKKVVSIYSRESR